MSATIIAVKGTFAAVKRELHKAMDTHGICGKTASISYEAGAPMLLHVLPRPAAACAELPVPAAPCAGLADVGSGHALLMPCMTYIISVRSFTLTEARVGVERSFRAPARAPTSMGSPRGVPVPCTATRATSEAACARDSRALLTST